MNKGLLVCISLLISIVVLVWYVVELSSDLALSKERERSQSELQADHKKAIKNAKSDCDERVKKAVEHERRANDFKDDINNPDSGIINFDFGV